LPNKIFTPSFQQISQQCFRLSKLITVCGIDKVTTRLGIGVENTGSNVRIGP
jgi:hypothetical protein